MSFTEPRIYLISYDIADPRRLQRVHHFLKRHAIPVQYSVFLTHLSERRLLSLLSELARRIDPRFDDVRAYPVSAQSEAVTLGRQYLPDGLLLADPLLQRLLNAAPRDIDSTDTDTEEQEEQEDP